MRSGVVRPRVRLGLDDAPDAACAATIRNQALTEQVYGDLLGSSMKKLGSQYLRLGAPGLCHPSAPARSSRRAMSTRSAR